MAKQPFENVVHHLFKLAARAEFKSLTDLQLLERYSANRDVLALGELMRRYETMIWNVCWRVLRHQQDTEDAFQATFMALFRQAAKIRIHKSIEGWLYHVVNNVAHISKRTRDRQVAREERRAKMQHESFHPSNSWELEEVLDTELARLPEKFRTPLYLCYLKGLTQKQAAEQLGIPLKNFERRILQGRERLQNQLSKYGLTLGTTISRALISPRVEIPAVPPDLVEKTLNMVRVMHLSNGSMEVAEISPQVVGLAKSALGIGTWKMKLCLGVLILTSAGVGAGVARNPGYLLSLMGWRQTQDEQPFTAKKRVIEPKANQILPRFDYLGDSLPAGALAHMGTVRFRSYHEGEVVFTPDSKAVGVLIRSKDDLPRLWDLKTGESVRRLGDSLKGQHYAGSWLSLDGRRMASGVRKRGARTQYNVREVTTGKLIRTFDESGDILRYAISPDGKALVGTFAHLFCLMDIATGEAIWEQQSKNIRDIPGQLVFSPNGKHIAVGYSEQIELRDALTGQLLRTLGHPWRLDTSQISFSPNGQTLVVIYAAEGDRKEPSVYLWDVATGRERWHLEQKGLFHFYFHPTFSPDGKILALHDLSIGTVEIGLYETTTGKKLGSCQQQDWGISFDALQTRFDRLTFSPDGKVLALRQRSLIRCWDVATGKVLVLPSFGHEAPVQSVTFGPDSNTLVSHGTNEGIHIWNSYTGQKQRTLRPTSKLQPRETLYTSQWVHPNATTAILCSNIIAGVYYEIIPPDEKKIASLLAEEIDNGELLRASVRANIYIWDAATGQEVRQIKLDCTKRVPTLCNLALSPDGKFLAAELSSDAFKFKFVHLWEVATGRQIGEPILGTRPTFSADSKLLMTYWSSSHWDLQKDKKENFFTIWKTATGEKISIIAGPKLEKLAVTPDWQTLVGVSSGRRWYLNSVHLEKQDKEMKIELGSPRYFDGPGIRCLAVAPDGKTVAWASSQIIHVMETASGAERAYFTGHKRIITSLAFSLDGRRLASGSEDTTILIWDMTGGRLDEQRQLRSVELSDQQIQRLWIDLSRRDAVQAGRATWILTAAAKQSVPFLAKHLLLISDKQASPQRIAYLIKDLDSNKYVKRQKAESELSKLGDIAEGLMRQALRAQPSAEVVHCLKRLLGDIEQDREDSDLSEIVLQSIRAIEILERIGTAESCRLLKTMSQGAPSTLERRPSSPTAFATR